MRLAVILTACVVCLASAQDDGPPHRGQFPPIPLRSTRYQRLPPPKPGQSSVFSANQRLRRPIPSFKPRGEDSPGSSLPFPPRPIRPSLPPLPIQSHIKPVNEETEEEERPIRDQPRDEDVGESEEEEDISEENVPRIVQNVGSSGPSRGPAQVHGLPLPGQYRPPPNPSIPTGRGISGNPPPPPPPPAPIQYRPPPTKPSKPRKPVLEEPIIKQQTVKPVAKPYKSSQGFEVRGKKPVAQIIRRYRNDNSDGSITWGFENDDGSYKEEIIGVDCITRGKYGYVDPDGLRREYTYETGIKCDEEDREEDEENGFVDYQENKLVLPDGKTIDLSSMGKKQARRPRPY